MPRFSIIVTCYNQSRFIRDAVDSALAQGGPDKEIVVVDDGSTDGSGAILSSYGRSITLKVLEINQGVSAARNWGASLSSGDFLVFLDGDDVLMPWALNVYGRVVDHKDPKVILCNMQWFKETLPSTPINAEVRKIDLVDYEAFMKKDRTYRSSGSAMVIARQCFRSVGGWTKEAPPMEDIDLLLKLGYSGRTIQILSPRTVAYRVHSANAVHQVQKMIDSLYQLIGREKMGQYPGGPAKHSERQAVIGGLVFFWIKRAFRAKFYRVAMRLLVTGWLMVLLAILRRAKAIYQGVRPVETLMNQ
jgi:glycosyltransferase involved in cell wall biosynthesis